jgi:hypothetical protein
MRFRYAALTSMEIAIPLIYLYGTFLTPVQLRVVLGCAGNNTQSTWCYDHSSQGFILNDGLLEKSPKLKEGLVKVLTTEPFLTNPRMYIVHMTMAEFDSMNRLLVSTNQDVLQQYPQKSNPTLMLFPKGNSVVSVNYNGNSYQLIPDYPVLAPFGQYPA